MNRFSIICLAASLAAAACSQDKLVEEGYGYLRAGVHADDNISDVIVPDLRSGDGGAPVFSLTVYDWSGEVAASVADCNDLQTEPLKLHAGTYTAHVFSADAGPAVFGTPFYAGSRDFTIESGKEANVGITASIANTRVTVEYSDVVKEKFESYVFTVTNGLGELTYSAAEGTESAEGYFSVTGTLSWTLSLVNSDGTPYKDITGTVADVEGGQHYRFSWDLDTEADCGAGAVTVILDDGTNGREFTIVLDPEDNTIPEISTGFEIPESGPVQVEIESQMSTLVLDVSSEDGFSNLVLTYPDPASLQQTEVDLCGAPEETVAALSETGIMTRAVTAEDTGCSIDLNSFVPFLPIGTYEIGVFAVDRGGSYLRRAVSFEVISDKEAEIVSVAPWAMFAEVKAKWFALTPPAGLGFQYRKVSDADWTDFTGPVSMDTEKRTYTASIRTLEPGTEYLVRAVSAEDKETKELAFTTEKAETIPNMSFDAWYQDGGAWYPNSGTDNFWWDTANGGTKTLSIYPTTPAEEEYIYAKGEGKNAAKLQSKEAALVGLAAGNIYTGKFVEAVISFSNPGARLDWGVPFSSRPLALKGFYHYLPKAVNKGSYNDMSGKPDIGQIQIMLTDWASPFRVDTAAGQFVNPKTDTGIIAYGAIDLNETEGYEPFTVDLEYRDLSRTPKYIVIVAAASKYGDYFTGGVGSTLYLDEFSFVYNPDELSE